MTPPPFTRGKAQPSLLKMWQAKFKNSIRAYLKVKADLDRIEKEMNEGGMVDTAIIVEHQAARDKERLLRGIVRGGAGMVLILCRPPESAYTGKAYQEAIHDLEVEYGMPGKKFRRQVNYAGQSVGDYMEDNRDPR